LRDKLDALSPVYGTAQVPAKNYTAHATTIDQLVTAAVECRRVLMRYHSMRTDQTQERFFEPYNVYFDPDGATLKVIGYDHQSKEIRLFSIDHVRGLSLTAESFARPSDWNLHDYLDRYCFNGIHGEPLTVRLRAYGQTARVFAERRFHRSQTWLERSAEATTIEMTVARGRGLERFILGWIPDIEVICPVSLREAIARTLQSGEKRFT
jgi:predicted DNA-binding transcriptional regulator YafY